MEGKRGIKRECSPSAEGSPTASDAKTPPPAPSETSPPLESPTEVSSHRPCSPVLEQGGPSGVAPVVDLSSPSDGEEPIHDTACDFEFAQRLFDELNRDLLGPAGDGKVIILSDSDEEKEETHVEKSAGAKDRDGNSGSGFESPVGFQPDGCGCNFAPVGPPTPNTNRIGCGPGFHFSPAGAPKTRKNSHNFVPAAQPNHFALNLSYNHMYIGHEP
jgi:hypothetical protein